MHSSTHSAAQNTVIKQKKVQKYHCPWRPHTYQLLRVITCWVKFKIITSSEYSSMTSSMKGWYSEALLMTSKDKKYALLWKSSFFLKPLCPMFLLRKLATQFILEHHLFLQITRKYKGAVPFFFSRPSSGLLFSISLCTCKNWQLLITISFYSFFIQYIQSLLFRSYMIYRK